MNSGHDREGAVVIRVAEAGKGFEVKTFSTWGAKTIALIGSAADTIEDRGVTIKLRRKLKSEKVARLRGRAQEIKNTGRKIARWAADNIEALRGHDAIVPREISNDRACDNWRTLLSIADLIGGEWPDKARAAARSMEGAGSEEPDADHIEGIRLLADIKTVFNRRKGLNGKPVQALSAADIIAEICNLEENPWADHKFGRRLSEMAFGQLLKDFEIKSRKVPSGPDKDRKRWYRADFDDAWQRYLPQNSETGGSTPFSASAASSGMKNKGNSAFKASSQEEAQNGKNPNDFNRTESAEAQDPPDGDDLSFSDGLGENGSKPPTQPSGDDDDELWELDDL